MNLFEIIFYLGSLQTVLINALDGDTDESVKHYEQVLRKLTDEIREEEVDKRDRMRLLEYLKQAIKDKQIELRMENDELKSRYLELNRTRANAEASRADINFYEDSSQEEEDLSNRIKELEPKIVVLRAYSTSVPQVFGARHYPFPLPQYNQARYLSNNRRMFKANMYLVSRTQVNKNSRAIKSLLTVLVVAIAGLMYVLSNKRGDWRVSQTNCGNGFIIDDFSHFL